MAMIGIAIIAPMHLPLSCDGRIHHRRIPVVRYWCSKAIEDEAPTSVPQSIERAGPRSPAMRKGRLINRRPSAILGSTCQPPDRRRFTTAATALPSALPATRLPASPITLPMSAMPVAFSAVIESRTRRSISTSLNRSGR